MGNCAACAQGRDVPKNIETKTEEGIVSSSHLYKK